MEGLNRAHAHAGSLLLLLAAVALVAAAAVVLLLLHLLGIVALSSSLAWCASRVSIQGYVDEYWNATADRQGGAWVGGTGVVVGPLSVETKKTGTRFYVLLSCSSLSLFSSHVSLSCSNSQNAVRTFFLDPHGAHSVRSFFILNAVNDGAE